MLRITAFKKSFGSSTVLAIPELTLPQNIYWLRGENGAGKTTLLKSLAGLLPFDGEILVNDTSLRKQRRAYTAIVNYAAAEPAYPEFLTGDDLVNFYLQTKKGDKEATNLMAAAFGMNTYLKNKVSSYSSGMTKKLSLLLAFTGRPKLILLDEPFTTLNAQAVHTLHAYIEESSGKGIGFCISSHHPLVVPHVKIFVQNKTISIG